MKTKIRKFPAAALFLTLCMILFPVSAFAAEPVEVKIPVSTVVSGETPSEEETYSFVLQSADGAPMPSESTLEITGEGTAEFPAVSYATPGIYCYTVTQQAGSHERGHYDETVYYVKVTVTNAENGGLEAVIAAHTDQQMVSAKQDIIFTNTYDPVPAAEVPEESQTTEEPQKTETVQKAASSQTVKTGDNADVALWVLLCCTAGCGGLMALSAGFRRKNG